MPKALYLFVRKRDGKKILIDKAIVIGRHRDCAIVLPEGHASRMHAKLSPGSDGIIVEDLNSTNGTLVNGKRITKPIVLKVGDELVIGKDIFTASLADKASIATAAEAIVIPEDVADFMETSSFNKIPRKAASKKKRKPKSKLEPKVVGHEPKVVQEVVSDELEIDSNAPPSWVLNNQEAVDGTRFIDKKIMQDVLARTTASATAEVATDRVRVPSLIGGSRPIEGLCFPLEDDDLMQWEVGRSSTCQVMINHDSVSTNHAQIMHENGRWKVVDLMSANGTYVNGKKSLSSYISSGDLLRFGQIECTFKLPEGVLSKAVKQTIVKSAKKSTKTFGKIVFMLLAGMVVIAIVVVVLIKTGLINEIEAFLGA